MLAGGSARPDDPVLRMAAEIGSETYGSLSNRFLAAVARTVHYEVAVTVGDGTFSYDERTTIEHARLSETLVHTDRNTLQRVEGGGPQAEVSLHQHQS